MINNCNSSIYGTLFIKSSRSNYDYYRFWGQALFATRFIIQWISSENAGKSVIPIAFWYFSISGGLVLLTYAIWRQDPVIIAGQSVGVFIYARNLYFIYREKN